MMLIIDGQEVSLDASTSKRKRRKPLYKQRWLWLTAGAIIAVLAVVGILRIMLNQVKMPDVVGLFPYEAKQQVQEISEKWKISFITSEGDLLTVTDEDSYREYEVKSTEPSVGATLDRGNSSQIIVITIQGVEQKEALLGGTRAEREVFMQARIEEWVAAGWLRVDYTDDDSSVIFNFYHPVSEHLNWGETLEEQQEWKNYYLASAEYIAEAINSNILMNFYTSDNNLYYSVVAPQPQREQPLY
jgi:hypothetical protein